MWPFEMRGPEFLELYLFVGVLVILATFLLRHAAESADVPRVNLSDPYLIAYLRGGKNETLRVATMSLLDRAMLVNGGKTIRAMEGALEKAQLPLEHKIVQHFAAAAEPKSLFKVGVEPEMRRYENELSELGLMPDKEIKDARLLRMAVALMVILSLAIVKIFVAVTTGHTNVAFLVVLMVLFSVVIIKGSMPRLTKAGERMIADLRTLFLSLKEKSQSIRNGASPAEFALMAAVFGMATLPDAKALFPQAGGSSGCGSSCGSGGSSCGGGGGCGGCGGG